MWNYTDKVMDHFLNPRNVGEVENPDGVGEVGNAACGDALKLTFKLDDQGRIADVKFKTFGCASAIASSSALTELVKGMTLEEAEKVTNQQIADMLPFYGERFTVVQMRKMTAFYLHGMRGAAKHKARLFTCNSVASLREALDDIFPA